MSAEPLLTIGEVAERAGLNTSHIRFYERVGVLPEPERIGGQRRYRAEVLDRLSIVDVAQRAGLSLEEIAPLTGPENRSADAGRHIRALADDKLPRIDALIARAQAVKHATSDQSNVSSQSATPFDRRARRADGRRVPRRPRDHRRRRRAGHRLAIGRRSTPRAASRSK